jgi:hypothetical protein
LLVLLKTLDSLAVEHELVNMLAVQHLFEQRWLAEVLDRVRLVEHLFETHFILVLILGWFLDASLFLYLFD